MFTISKKALSSLKTRNAAAGHPFSTGMFSQVFLPPGAVCQTNIYGLSSIPFSSEATGCTVSTCIKNAGKLLDNIDNLNVVGGELLKHSGVFSSGLVCGLL